MRIEKINDHQIRCTLNQKDLKDRELRISELAYGTEKAKALFRDMMQQASYEFGFEVDDIPLMIEAIPMLPDALVLVITKVEDPDELDTRFSHFTDDPEDAFYQNEESDIGFDFSGSLLEEDGSNLANTLIPSGEEISTDDIAAEDVPFEPLSFKETEGSSDKSTDFISLSEALGMEPRPKTKPQNEQTDLIRTYRFHSLNQLTALGEHLLLQYQGQNTIYKNPTTGEYILILHKSEHTPEEFSKICNTISEYGTPVQNTYASSSYYEEHFDALIRDKALQILGNL